MLLKVDIRQCLSDFLFTVAAIMRCFQQQVFLECSYNSGKVSAGDLMLKPEKNFSRYQLISEWLLLQLTLFIYICFYEGGFLYEFSERVVFQHLLVHKSYIFLLFECPLKLLRKDMKSSLNILLLSLYFNPQGHCSISASITDKQ